MSLERKKVMLDEFCVTYRASELPPKRKDLRAVLTLQEDEKINILKKMRGGRNILHIAARRGHHDVLTIIFKAVQKRKDQMELLLQTKKITWWACYNPFTRCNTVLHEAVYAPPDKMFATVKAILELDGLHAVDRFTLLTTQNDRGFTALEMLEKMGDNFTVRNLFNEHKQSVDLVLNAYVSNPQPQRILTGEHKVFIKQRLKYIIIYHPRS